jgi:pyruvate kinase
MQTARSTRRTSRQDTPISTESAPPASDHDLLRQLAALREDVARETRQTLERWRPKLKRLGFLPSALNLASYLAFRKRDIRPFQDELAVWGLSSLGRSESHVLANLDAVLNSLAALTHATDARIPARPRRATFQLGGRLLERNTRQLFGQPRGEGDTRVMVTLPEEAASDAALVRALVAAGMSCARINCAHGTHKEWRAMVHHVRAAEKRLGRSCRVLMDLCGPRVRTVSVLSRGDRELLPGDRLLLRATAPDSCLLSPPFQAECTPASILERLKVGSRILIDEGKIEAVVEKVARDGVVAEATRTPPSGAKLKPEKGLNFPGTDLGLAALTDKDRVDLDMILENADLVGYSFVQDESDIESLWREIKPRLKHLRRPTPGLILKIETEEAVRHLPELIVAAAAHAPVGVMIARGDLAVEVGFHRLAELQEELLWLAEAAHTPVIWATQVLEQLVKKGTPSRAEISDVVLAQRAECVMLNKGEFVLDALKTVNDVFHRMGDHQHKKTARLRALRAWS